MILTSRRVFLAGALASVLLAVTACGGGDSSSSSSGGAASGAFPVTIGHKYGSTTITAEPKRIVTVGVTEQDALLALGVVPVGTTRWLGKYEGEIGPWAQAKLGTAAKPEVLTDTGGPQFEKIAALRPDLIIGLYSALTQEQYETLSKIAPTVAQPKEYDDFGVPWQVATRTVGQAVGKAAEADRLVTDIEARFAKARQDNPAFAGATALMATTWEGYFVYGSEDPRSRLLTSLGFRLPASLDQVIGDQFGANISAERTDLLNVDALIWFVGSVTEGRATLDADKLYSGLTVAAQKRDVLIEESSDYGGAVSFASVLSLPYVLERLVPQLAAAVDGNPGT